MKDKLVAIGVVVAGLVGIVALYQWMPQRVSVEQMKEALAVEEQVAQIEARREHAEKTAAAKEEAGVQAAVLPSADTGAVKEGAASKKEGSLPDVFKVKFECSDGTVVVECHKDWAPLGVERFATLVKEGFFNDVRFFRVVTNPRPFVVQFGISGDPQVSAKWRNARIKDDPVRQSNARGTIVFATSGPNSRTTQVFINLGDNASLDGMGFAPFGKVVEGMDVVDSFNNQYQEAPTKAQAQIQAKGNAFLDQQFPGLDYIKSAAIMP